MMDIQQATLNARAARMDLPMLGVAVKGGRFSIVYFPRYGQGPRRYWYKVREIIRDNLPADGVVAALREIGEGAA